jgi:hypothetical protein
VSEKVPESAGKATGAEDKYRGAIGLGELESPERYYDLEGYLFREVSTKWASHSQLSAFDFFCIVIWKANRSKSRVAKRLLAQGDNNLQAAVTSLTSAIASAADHKERLRTLVEKWGFRLPMASAILTVLFPRDFTVYDVRVCAVLEQNFKDAQYKTRFEALWKRYSEYTAAVREAVPQTSDLRGKDRYLWGKSFATQLLEDIEDQFDSAEEDSELEA